eukprot:3605111-Rhodomonas_salina.1
MATDDDNNICMHNPLQKIPDTCTHYQGILGGGTGDPVESIEALYHETPTVLDSSVEPFLIATDLAIWKGLVASAALSYKPLQTQFVSMPENLIYPAHIVTFVPGGSRAMKIHSMQMKQNERVLLPGTPTPVSEWVGQLQA